MDYTMEIYLGGDSFSIVDVPAPSTFVLVNGLARLGSHPAPPCFPSRAAPIG